MWVCEPTTPYHEEPGAALPGLLTRIASVRGSPVKCYGTMDLMVRDRRGAPRRIMQADQSAYLHPSSAHLPGPAAMVVGEHDFPDVVLEVDHTTDARRGKLEAVRGVGLSRGVDSRAGPAGGEPPPAQGGGTDDPCVAGRRVRGGEREPDVAGLDRSGDPPRLRRGHAFGGDPAGTRAGGLALGAREGTGPDDDPLLGAQRREAEARGRAEGRADSVRQILLSRGIAVSAAFPMRLPGLADLPKDRVIAAALACESEADFEARIQGTGD